MKQEKATTRYSTHLTYIDAGIGDIGYETNNLQLEELMQALAERIKKFGAQKTLQHIQRNIYEATTR